MPDRKHIKDDDVDNLKEKTAKGVEWGFIDNLGGTGILAVVNLVLARLLTPQEFGIVGMTSIFITLSTSLVDSGFTGALTRKKTVDEKDLNTVFHFNLLTSVILYLILFFTAPLIAGFFRQPVLTEIVRILGLSLIVTALSIVQKVILVRKLDFRTQAIVSVISALAGGSAGILMAVAGFGVWSLVVMQLSRLVLTTLLLWVFSRWLPSFMFSMASFREMFSFGGRLLLTAIISTLWSEIYSFIIGKVYAPSVLGQYSRADKFRNMVTSNVSIVMQRVTYPVLASISDDRQRQKRAYRKILRTTVLISFTAVLGLASISEAFVLTLVGEQWIPAIGYLRILCLSGLFVPLMICSANILNANGRSDTTLRLEIMKTALAVIPVLAGIYISMEALLWSAVAVSALSYLVYAAMVSRHVGYSVASQLKDIFPFLLVSLVMAAVVYCVSYVPLPQWAVLLLQLVTGAAVVILAYERIYPACEYGDVRQALLKMFRNRRHGSGGDIE